MAGKGDKPRNCFSKEFKNNYEEINWENKKQKIKKVEIVKENFLKNEK